ncbi:MAG: radical SAM protein [candidate division KSB1 bacterium]|nr:radical SAM protein [candidate division KSB1 bacterium]MDZ7301704.1 radical SAM protein [candidate division KSB1 bacterium]MDZ7312409.1 radical SAM protein [candidate division KSB1 bacterium]
MPEFPKLVVANAAGEIFDMPDFHATGRSGREIYPLDPSVLIPLPESSRLYFLPQRQPLGFAVNDGAFRVLDEFSAVAAFLPPGYTIFSLAAYHCHSDAPLLPLYAYSAVCWYRGRFHVPAQRVDDDVKHDPKQFSLEKIKKLVAQRSRQFPRNRLIAHLGINCALRYGCPNAQNLFLNRWEAPLAVSAACNASCVGCISEQPPDTVQSPQERLRFVPTVEEMVEIAVPHLENAPKAIISFGQGCEGEPLLQGALIAAAIKKIRRQTNRGTIHLNTNGSLPEVLSRLIDAGLDSIRVSLNSARERIYGSYYQPRHYCFADVVESIRRAQRHGLWTSINYLCFPGVTDDEEEFVAFSKLIETTNPRMIQWRNLNIDPDWYVDTIGLPDERPATRVLGMPVLLQKVRERFPNVRFGYFNPSVR